MARLVRDVMTPNVLVVHRGDGVIEAEKLFLRGAVHGLPVVDEAERIVGLVSQADLLAWHACPLDAERPGADGCRVGDVMSPVVHCIRPERPVFEAAARMIREKIHRLVVVDDRYSVVGIVSAIDLLREMPGVEVRTDAAC